MSNRRVKSAVNETSNDDEPLAFEDAEVLETDETAWVLVGDTWVDVSRIIAVAPLAAIWDEEQGVPEPEGGVAVQIDSPHSDSQFIQNQDDTVEEVMNRILEATTE